MKKPSEDNFDMSPQLVLYHYTPMTFNDCRNPSKANPDRYLKTNKATIGETSIGPSGGMNRLKKPRYGSTSFEIHNPIFEDWN